MIENIIDELSNKSVVIVNQNDLKTFLSQVRVLREENTHLCDYIRIVEYGDNILIQEMSNKNEIIIRKMNSLDDAEKFVQERLDYYDRKWDGCGCKVDYYS